MTAAALPTRRLLEVKGLSKHFSIHAGFWRRVVGTFKAVDDVSFHIEDGETLGLVGESGCGKTTTARCVLRAIEPSAGKMVFRMPDGDEVDIATMSSRELSQLRRHVQMIFQDPFSSLNPRMTLFEIVGEPLLNYGMRSRAAREERVAELLRLVGLRPEYMSRFPHAFSGGQRQRIGIARALALNPRLVVADEPVSALDVSVQAQVLNLMMDLREELGLAYLFVAHDLSVVKQFSHRVAVMYLGRIVETGPTEPLFAHPRHPYTEALLSAVPKPDPRKKSRRIVLEGEVGNAVDPPSGCAFHPRCAYATEICRREVPQLEEVAPRQMARCHHARDLNLQGIAGISVPTAVPA